MWKYATRRVLTMIPILIGVSMVVFLLVASLPEMPLMLMRRKHHSGEDSANKALLGLDKPIPERYVNGKSCDQRRFWYLNQLQDSGNRSHR